MILKNIVQRKGEEERGRRGVSKNDFEKTMDVTSWQLLVQRKSRCLMRLAYLAAADEWANVSADAWRETRAMTSR